MAKPKKIAAPKSSLVTDLSTTLKAIQKANKSHGTNRQRGNQSLRVTRAKLPSAAELLRDTATPPIGLGERTRGTPLPPNTIPSAADLFAAGEEEGLLVIGGTTAEGEAPPDRTEYLSPPKSIEPGRPRALEASYNPDTRQMRVIFRDGGTYVYYEVLPQTWRALKTNRSFGQTFDRLVKNVHSYEKVAF